MEKLICKECGKVFEYGKLSSCRSQLTRHLIEEHSMSIEDYVVKHEYNGIHPKCPCGCGHDLKLKTGGHRWEFNKYYSDTCYGSLVRKCNAEVLKNYNETHKNKFDIVKYYETHYDRKTYEEALGLLKSKEFTLTDISKTYKIDKRTLKKVWLALKLIDVNELTELLEYTKYKMPVQSKNDCAFNNDEIMSWCYNLIKTFPCKYTAHSLVREFNKAHKDNQTQHSGEVIVRGLRKVYGDEIEMYLAEGFHSSEEYKFYEILRFYLKDYSIKLGKKFILENGYYIYYDILVGSRLLIEYDSDGYFHKDEKAKEKDTNKEQFAIDNGYKFLRLTKNDILDINTVIKIKNILEK